jgi:hypothetical protein
MVRAAWMEKIMSKTEDTERTPELKADRDEFGLDTVTGGGQLSLAYANVVKAIGSAVSAAGEGSPSVLVGIGWW